MLSNVGATRRSCIIRNTIYYCLVRVRNVARRSGDSGKKTTHACERNAHTLYVDSVTHTASGGFAAVSQQSLIFKRPCKYVAWINCNYRLYTPEKLCRRWLTEWRVVPRLSHADYLQRKLFVGCGLCVVLLCLSSSTIPNSTVCVWVVCSSKTSQNEYFEVQVVRAHHAHPS